LKIGLGIEEGIVGPFQTLQPGILRKVLLTPFKILIVVRLKQQLPPGL
jgi:hypothetical protein